MIPGPLHARGVLRGHLGKTRARDAALAAVSCALILAQTALFVYAAATLPPLATAWLSSHALNSNFLFAANVVLGAALLKGA